MKVWQSFQRVRQTLSLENRADGGVRFYGVMLAVLLGTLLLVLTLAEPATALGEGPRAVSQTR
jgi:hypothetical protein